MMTDTDTEKRGVQRRSTLKGGKIVFNAGRSTIDCTLRNLSSTGAKLTVSSVGGMPDTFDLVLDGGAKQPCRIKWRRLKEIGVEFRRDH